MLIKHTSGNHSKSATARGSFTLELILGLLLAVSTTDLWAHVRATLDRTNIAGGDTVTLTISSEGQQSGRIQPDLSPLRKDFTILGTSTSQQVQVINGQMSSSTRLSVGLEPKHEGRIEIPALKVGGETTSPLTLTVADQPAATAASQPGSPLYLETEVKPRNVSPFVQQEIQYTTRLYYSQPLTGGTLADPDPEHAVVERLGDDEHYQTTVNGQRYQVIERNYAIFPEKSGVFTIPPVSFTGRMATEGSRRSPFGRMDAMMQQFFGHSGSFPGNGFFSDPFGDPGKRVHARSESVTVDVKPHPASYSGTYWLPGEDLVLHDSWTDHPPEFKVGEPVTRKITIDAKGLAASHLPDIRIPAIANVQVYPEQPVRDSRTDGTTVYGHSEQSFAFVPQQAGKITLPEIRLPWWDIKANKERVAVLPSWTVDVQPGVGGTQSAPVTPPPPTVANKPAAPSVAGISPEATPARGWTRRLMDAWPQLAGAFAVLVLVLVVLFAWRRRAKQRRPAATTTVTAKTADVRATPVPDAGEARRALQEACAANDARSAARAMLDWAAAEWPDSPPRNLGSIASRLKSGAAEVRRLDQSLYAPGGAVWDGAPLWNLFRDGMDRKPAEPASTAGGLAPLYPEWGKRHG
jgi:hypothetical protein